MNALIGAQRAQGVKKFTPKNNVTRGTKSFLLVTLIVNGNKAFSVQTQSVALAPDHRELERRVLPQ